MPVIVEEWLYSIGRGSDLVYVDPSRCTADMNVDIKYILSLDRS